MNSQNNSVVVPYQLVPQETDILQNPAKLAEPYKALCIQLQEVSTAQQYKNVLEIEQQKLAVLEDFFRHISGDPGAYPAEQPISYLWLRRIGLWTALPLAMSLNAIGEFLFIHDLLQLIPNISNPVLLVSSAVCTLLTSLLYYTWEIELLRKALGIKHYHSKLAQQFECQAKQVNVAKQIITKYENVQTIANIDDIEGVREFVKIIADDFAGMKEKMVKVNEPLSFKLFKWSITGFGATMSIASGFFYAKYLMLMLCPLMLTTPTGILLIAITCAVSLALFAAVRASGMMGLQSPELQHAKALQQEMKTFNPCDDNTHKLVEKFKGSLNKPACLKDNGIFNKLPRSYSANDLSRIAGDSRLSFQPT